MKSVEINEIRNLYWKVETINKKHKNAHLAAEIYYCAHIFIGIFILLLKLEYFSFGTDIFINPPVWFGVLFPLLTIGKYSINYISIIATALCFIIVPAIISTLVYCVFSIPLKKNYTLKKNPYKNAKNNDIFDKCQKIKSSEPCVVKVLKNRIHSVVWIQVLFFAILFIVLVILGAIQNTIKPEEVGAGILCAIFVSPAYSIALYLLRWFEYRLFIPLDKIFNAVYKKRIKNPLSTICESSSYISYVKTKTDMYYAKIEREKRQKIEEERKREEYKRIAEEHVKNSPVFIDDIMRAVRKSEEQNNSTTNSDPLGKRDGVHVDGRGI